MSRKPSLSFKLVVAFFLSAAFSACTPTQNPDSDFDGIVSSAAPEATAAGVEILEAGGNAIDAAVAVSFALGVAEPAMSGLGGGVQIIFHAPGKEPVVINGTSFSPHATPTNAKKPDISGHRATTIPSTVRVLHYAWQNHGSGKIAWADLLAPAIRYAEQGFVIGPFRHKVLQRHYKDLAAQLSTSALYLNDDGSLPEEGVLWKQPVLARTLRRLAEHGADDFYQGQIAREIADDMANNGGWMTLEDLNHFPQPVELKPLKSTYRDWDVYSLTPPGGGWVVLQILNLLEQSSASDLAPDSPTRVQKLANALRIAHTSRRTKPVTDLVDFEDAVQKRISKETAKRLLQNTARKSSGETTHFSVVDAEGMVVGVTASINAYYGARVATPSLGFLYNDYMNEFEIDSPGHPFAIRPNAMPYSSMSPTILAKEGVPQLVVGSPGSSRIISAVAQVIQLWVDTDMGIKGAVVALRMHVHPTAEEIGLYVENPTTANAKRAFFEQLGYTLKQPSTDLANGDLNPYFGGVHAIAKNNGKWYGAADPRRDGMVMYAKSKR